MRSYLWPILLLLVLWVLMTVVLPAWFPVVWIPNLLVAGVVVLAVTDTDFRWFWLALVAGLFLDLQHNLLIGSFLLGFCVLYIVVGLLFKRLVPSSHIYVMLPLMYFIGVVLLRLWAVVYGLLGGVLGWSIRPQVSVHSSITFIVATGIGSLVALVVYILWLEVMHRFDRPLRLRR